MVKSTKMLNKHFGSSYLFLYQSVFPVQLFPPFIAVIFTGQLKLSILSHSQTKEI